LYGKATEKVVGTANP